MNNTNIMRGVLSAYAFSKETFDLRTLEEKHFVGNDSFLKFFKALKNLQIKKLDFDEALIQRELESLGVVNPEHLILDVLSATPITNTKHHESIIIEDWQSSILRLEMMKIFDKDGLTSAERSARITKLQEQFRKADSTQPLIKIYDSSKVKPESPKFYLKDMFPVQKNEIGLLTASGGGGKSFTVLLLAAALETFENLKVFTFLSEDSVGVSRKRLDTIKNVNPKLKNAYPAIAGKDSLTHPFLEKTAKGYEASSYFYAFKTLMKDYDVVILDPLIAFILEDENNNVEARRMFSILNQWIEEEDKTLIIVHHHSKADSTRGASSIVDAVRMHYVLAKNKEDDTKRDITIEKTNHYPGKKKDFTVKLFGKKFDITFEDSLGNIEEKFSSAEIVDYEMPTLNLDEVADEHTKVVKIVDFEE